MCALTYPYPSHNTSFCQMHKLHTVGFPDLKTMEFEAGVVLPDLSGFTLLLPSVSVGNVGQLAIDVVLATLKPTLITQVRVQQTLC